MSVAEKSINILIVEDELLIAKNLFGYQFDSVLNNVGKRQNWIIRSELFASNPLRPADGTAYETCQEPGWSSVSACEKLFLATNKHEQNIN